MSIIDKKQALSEGNHGKSGKIPSPKEEKIIKKDTTAFESDKYLGPEEARKIFKDPSLYREYHIEADVAKKMGDRVTDYKKIGPLVDIKNIKDYKDELKKERENIHDFHKRFEIDRKLKFLKDKFGV
jgi:hypothetical protein